MASATCATDVVRLLGFVVICVAFTWECVRPPSSSFIYARLFVGVCIFNFALLPWLVSVVFRVCVLLSSTCDHLPVRLLGTVDNFFRRYRGMV